MVRMCAGGPVLAVVGLVLGWGPWGVAGEAPVPEVREQFPYHDFLVIPLRVHILRAEDLPEVDCRLTDRDVRRILGKVNAIWNPAGIHFGLESIRREEAAGRGRFRVARDLDGRTPAPHGLFPILRPEGSRDLAGLHVYYVHDFDVNGVAFGRGFAFVKETARLHPVPGGIDEPIPRVTAHELGHALGLPHRQDRTNLMASGTTGTSLNDEEAALARDGARRLEGTRSVDDLRREAAQAGGDGRPERVRQIETWLAEIPGSEAEPGRHGIEKPAESAGGSG